MRASAVDTHTPSAILNTLHHQSLYAGQSGAQSDVCHRTHPLVHCTVCSSLSLYAHALEDNKEAQWGWWGTSRRVLQLPVTQMTRHCRPNLRPDHTWTIKARVQANQWPCPHRNSTGVIQVAPVYALRQSDHMNWGRFSTYTPKPEPSRDTQHHQTGSASECMMA